MATQIVVAGATGNLGTRITRELIKRGADVVALARPTSADDKVHALEALGAHVVRLDMNSTDELTLACDGAACVVSVLQGLRDVIVHTQSVLLDAAITAGVPRFLPSDFSTDFTPLSVGENRNFDLRRAFHAHLAGQTIASTSIFNGAFAEILSYNIPLLNFKDKTVGYWEDADWHIDFTTMDDTAAYTASAALDPSAPPVLRIASFQITPRTLADFTRDTLKTPFALTRLGSLDELKEANRRERAAHPEGENEVFPAWQQSQYLHSMFSVHHAALDNDRYPDLTWTPLQDALKPRA